MQYWNRSRLIGKEEEKEDDEEFEAYVTALYTITPEYQEAWDAAFRDYAGNLTRGVTLEPLRRAVETGDIEVATERLSWQDAEKTFLIAAIPMLLLALERGGAGEAARLGLTFDTPVAETVYGSWFLQENGAALVQQINSETRQALRNVLAHAYREGLSPAQVAPRIRQLVGLTDKQAGAVLRYWQSLELPPRQAAKLADEYAERLLQQRVSLIAESEWVRAASAGQHSAFLEARNQGLIPATARRQWVAIRDERLCPICGKLDGTVVGLTESFQFGALTVLYPPIHPLCRCAVIIM